MHFVASSDTTSPWRSRDNAPLGMNSLLMQEGAAPRVARASSGCSLPSPQKAPRILGLTRSEGCRPALLTGRSSHGSSTPKVCSASLSRSSSIRCRTAMLCRSATVRSDEYLRHTSHQDVNARLSIIILLLRKVRVVCKHDCAREWARRRGRGAYVSVTLEWVRRRGRGAYVSVTFPSRGGPSSPTHDMGSAKEAPSSVSFCQFSPGSFTARSISSIACSPAAEAVPRQLRPTTREARSCGGSIGARRF